MKEIMFKDHGERRAFLDALKSICINRPPKSYLEIGVHTGESLKCVLENSNPHPISITLCDNWSIDYSTHYNNHYYSSFDHIEKLLDEINYKGERELIVGDSHIILPNITRKYDLILVDADHSYDGALQDLMNSWNLLNKNGLIVMDDLNYFNDPHLFDCFKDFCKKVDGKIVYLNRDKKNGVGVISNV